jgi:hypothetical protein
VRIPFRRQIFPNPIVELYQVRRRLRARPVGENSERNDRARGELEELSYFADPQLRHGSIPRPGTNSRHVWHIRPGRLKDESYFLRNSGRSMNENSSRYCLSSTVRSIT